MTKTLDWGWLEKTISDHIPHGKIEVIQVQNLAEAIRQEIGRRISLIAFMGEGSQVEKRLRKQLGIEETK